MDKIENWLKILGIAALAAVAVGGVGWGVAQKIYVKGISAKVKQWTFSKVSLLMTMQIVNKTPLNVPVDAIRGVLLYGKYPVAQILATQKQVLAGNQTADFVLDVEIPYDNLIAQVKEIFRVKNFYNGLYFDGIVVSGGVNIKIYQNIQIL